MHFHCDVISRDSYCESLFTQIQKKFLKFDYSTSTWYFILSIVSIFVTCKRVCSHPNKLKHLYRDYDLRNCIRECHTHARLIVDIWNIQITVSIIHICQTKRQLSKCAIRPTSGSYFTIGYYFQTHYAKKNIQRIIYCAFHKKCHTLTFPSNLLLLTPKNQVELLYELRTTTYACIGHEAQIQSTPIVVSIVVVNVLDCIVLQQKPVVSSP
jgi:hypothetical protein